MLPVATPRFGTSIGPGAARKLTVPERQLQRFSVETARQQLAAIERQQAFQTEQFRALEPLLQEQLLSSQEARARASELAPVQEELLQLELGRIRQGTAATPEQRRLIGEATQAAIATGESDISRFQEQGLNLLRSELAPSLGLRPSDTPITARGVQIGEEAARQQGQLVRGLRGAQAQAELNFPLQAGAFEAGRTQFQQNLATSAQQFQAQLRQQAFQNRLSATGQVGQSNLALAGTPFIGSNTISPGVGTQKQESSGGGIGSTLSGIGALFTGGAALLAL